MILDTDGMKPIYVQIAEWLEGEILNGNIEEDGRIYSQYQLADMFNINPATAAKGLNILAAENIIYKKRGLGMFVTPDAKECIHQKRKTYNLKNLIYELVGEAKRLDISDDELIRMVMDARQENKEV